MSGWLADRAHPWTPPSVTAAVVALALVLPAPAGPVALYAATALFVLLVGGRKAVWQAGLVSLPLWAFLAVLHGALGEAPHMVVLGIRFSESGVVQAMSQGARLGAIITASLAAWHAFDPARLLDAVAERGGRRAWLIAYLATATLHTLHRFDARARAIVEAQRARGLAFGGSPLARLKALGPITLPLMLSALMEIEERALALDTRGADAQRARTPLFPRRDSGLDRAIRWGALATVLAGIAWRVAR